MTDAQVLKVMLLLWAVLFGLSLGWRFWGDATGGAGMDRALISLTGQFLAATVAMMIWSRAKSERTTGLLRVAAMVPILVTIGMLCLAVWSVLSAMMAAG